MKNLRVTILTLCAVLLAGAIPEVKPEVKLGKQKITKFNVFWHDILNGTNATAVSIVPPVNKTSSRGNAFGMVRMMDNVLTEGPSLWSKKVGRAQGLYAMASQEEVAALMVMNLIFLQGKYNGSSLTVTGWNPVVREKREMPVVGGSGYFRFANGFVTLKTSMFDPVSQNAIVEYRVYVLHY